MSKSVKSPTLRTKAIDDLRCQAIAGDEGALTQLQKEAPEQAAAVLERCGWLEGILQQTLFKRIGIDQNPVGKQAVITRCQQLRDQLAQEGDSPLERLLIERIVVCWLAVYTADLKANLTNERSFAHGKYYLEHQDKAHRRFISAVKALAQVRRLLGGPVLQVNVAEKGSRQVNVLGG